MPYDLMNASVEISNKVRYRIYATERYRENYGKVISKTRLDKFQAVITVYESGKVVIESPMAGMEYDLVKGEMNCS